MLVGVTGAGVEVRGVEDASCQEAPLEARDTAPIPRPNPLREQDVLLCKRKYTDKFPRSRFGARAPLGCAFLPYYHHGHAKKAKLDPT